MSEQSKVGSLGWPWAGVVAGLFPGQSVGEFAAYMGAKLAGVESPGATPHVAALVKAHEDGRLAAGVGAVIAGYALTYILIKRGRGRVRSILAGAFAATICGGIVGFFAGYF